MAGESLEMWN